MNRILDKYLKDIRKCLPCNNTVWKDISKDFNNALSTFCDENPNFDEHLLIDAFGTPQEMADELLKKVPLSEIERYKKIRLNAIISICSVIAVVCIFSMTYALIIKKSAEIPANTETTLIIGDEVVVSSSDELENNKVKE